MRRSVGLFCALQLVVVVATAQAQQIRVAPKRTPGDRQLPSGYTLRVAAASDATTDLLGRGFNEDLSPIDTEAPRVSPGSIKEIHTRRFELNFERIENSIQLGAHASFLFSLVGAQMQIRSDRRYAVLRASYIDKVVTLDADNAPAGDGDFYAAKLYYGWSLYIVIEGAKSEFTTEVAGMLQGVGLGIGAKASEHHLQTHVYAIGLEPKIPGEVVLPTSNEDISKHFKQSPISVPILVEYVARRPISATAVSWSSSPPFETGRQYRVVVRVEVQESKADGRPWDVSGGAPDPLVKLRVGGKLHTTCDQKNSYICLGETTLTILEATSIDLDVVDKDLAADDEIGTAGPITPATHAKVSEPFDLPTHGQVKRATVTFFPMR